MMKVYVTQGHEAGIGLEVFLKSCLTFSSDELTHLHLIAYKKSVLKTLESLKVPHTLETSGINVGGVFISATWLTNIKFSESLDCLNLGMSLAEKGGVLYTLPTSKDQFRGHAGHTEYFRDVYENAHLGMFFSAPALKVLLLTDHLPVASLSKYLTEEVIYKRMETAFSTLAAWKWPTDRIIVSGLNPHAGEGGLIGSEDARVTTSLRRLKKKYKFDITGPFPGDTMLFEQRSPKDILVYLYHDQGLGVFKTAQGFIGSNITLGLPFPRFSPDHGTSFKLFGQNLADYRGCAYSLREAISMLKRVSYGKNSSHKSQSP